MKNKVVVTIIIILLVSAILVNSMYFYSYIQTNETGKENDNNDIDIIDIKDKQKNQNIANGNTNQNYNKTKPKYPGKISIMDIGDFSFDTTKVTSVRPDIFRPGFFSIFDILVQLNSSKSIHLNYHFDKSMNTNVIDSINGISNWWYYAYYDGGWRESNAFRMDHYPYKDNTTIVVFQEDKSVIEDIYEIFKEEVKRKESNNGRLIIPRVIIRGPTNDLAFNNVEVTPHNLRNDTFQARIITAIDVIMSLGDRNEITYELRWYETIGAADTVKDYWVHGINDDEAYDTCGFVYEAGSFNFKYSRNHIHIPSDIRVINSPEYEEWFWICL